MPPGQGHKSYLQWGPKEATYGAFQAPTQKLELVSSGVEIDRGVIRDPSLYAQVARRGLYPGAYLYRGPLVLRLNYEGMLEIFRGAFGSYSNALVETGVRDHTFKSGSLLNSYSPEIIQGDIPTTKCFRVLGAKLPSITIRGKAGSGDDAMVMMELNVLAKDKISDVAPTASLNFPAVLPVLYHSFGLGGAVVDDGTADAASSVRVREFEVKLEQPHTDFDRSYLGSQTIDEPLRSDFVTATWRLTQEFTTKTQFDAARNFTEGSPRLVFQDSTVIGATSKREFELRSNRANLVNFSDPVEGYGVLISTATWEAFHDDTDVSALVARFRNTEAALT
jgi:hypothetical protein